MAYFDELFKKLYESVLERLPYVRPAYRKLDVFVTDEYTADFAWAHTIPSRHVICIRPPERRDYRLPTIEHEIEHNVDPHASEALVTRRAFDASREPLRKRFVLTYHGGI